PHDGVPHDGRGRRQVAADRREVEWRYRVDEPLEGTVIEVVPGTRGGNGLLPVDALCEVHVEAEEVDQLACRVDLRLMGRLRLTQHGGGVHDRTVARREQIRGLQEHRRPPLESPPRPVTPGVALRRYRRLHFARPRLLRLREDVALEVGHYDVDRLAGADVLAPDDEGNVGLTRRQVLEGLLELDPLRRGGRVAQNGFVDWGRDFRARVHAGKIQREPADVQRAR